MVMDIIKIALKLVFKKGTFLSYSQFGEDALLMSLFRGKKDGVYVDVGAYHPHLYSNTYAFYARGWKGLVLDPSLRTERLFSIFRPRDTFVRSGVGAQGTRKYYLYEDGAYNGFTKQAVASRLLKTYTVSIEPLGYLLKRHNISHIDLLNIDAEGMDEEIIHSYDWSVYPTVLLVESKKNSSLDEIIRGRGYDFIAAAGSTLIFRRINS